jgi:hypothetical protein
VRLFRSTIATLLPILGVIAFALTRLVDYNARRRKPKETRSCEECGDPFTTAIPHRKFCGRKCKKRAENRRLRAGEPVIQP